MPHPTIDQSPPFLLTDDYLDVRRWADGLTDDAARDVAFALVMSLRGFYARYPDVAVRGFVVDALNGACDIVAESIS